MIDNELIYSFLIGIISSTISCYCFWRVFKKRHTIFDKYPIEIKNYLCNILISQDGDATFEKVYSVVSNRKGISNWKLKENIKHGTEVVMLGAKKNDKVILTKLWDNQDIQLTLKQPLQPGEITEIKLRYRVKKCIKKGNDFVDLFFPDPVNLAKIQIIFEGANKPKNLNTSITKGSVTDEIFSLESKEYSSEKEYTFQTKKILPGTRITFRWGDIV